jgi:hypothetical protein
MYKGSAQEKEDLAYVYLPGSQQLSIRSCLSGKIMKFSQDLGRL